jgi:hypothetical protein
MTISFTSLGSTNSLTLVEKKTATKSGDASSIAQRDPGLSQQSLIDKYAESMKIINQTPSRVAIAITESQGQSGVHGAASLAAMGQGLSAEAFVAELNIELEDIKTAGKHAVITVASQFFEASSADTAYPAAGPEKSYSPLVLFHV